MLTLWFGRTSQTGFRLNNNSNNLYLCCKKLTEDLPLRYFHPHFFLAKVHWHYHWLYCWYCSQCLKNRQCSVSYTLHIISDFLMTTINMFAHASVYGTYFFYIRFLYFYNLFHLTDGHKILCACAFILSVAERFAAFIYTHISIVWSLSIFRYTQSLFLALTIVRTWRFLLFVRFLVACTHYFDDFQFFTIQKKVISLCWHVQLLCWYILFRQRLI